MSSNPSQNKPTNSRKKLKLKQKSNSDNSPRNSRYEENEEQDVNANDRDEFVNDNRIEYNDNNKKQHTKKSISPNSNKNSQVEIQNNNKQNKTTTKLPNIYNSSTSSHFSGYKSNNLNKKYGNQCSPYDFDGMVQELNYSKNNIHALNHELKALKIAYTKLQEFNFYNKKIIEEVLKIEPGEDMTEKEFSDKIENSNPNEEEIEKLKLVHKLIIMKNKNEEMKKLLEKRNNEIKSISNNTKIKELRKKESTVLIQDKEIKALQNENEMLVDMLDKKEKVIADLQVKSDFYKTKHEDIQNRLKEIENDLENEQNKNSELRKQIQKNEEKMRRNEAK